MFTVSSWNGSRLGTFRLQLFTAPGTRPVAVATQGPAEGGRLASWAGDYAAEVWWLHFPGSAEPPVWVILQLLPGRQGTGGPPTRPGAGWAGPGSWRRGRGKPPASEEGDHDAEAEALHGKRVGKASRLPAGTGCEPWPAEETTSSTFLAPRRRRDVFKVAGNMCKRQQPGHDARARGPRPDPAAAAVADGDFTEAATDRDAAQQALRQLPARAREAVVPRPAAETAAITGTSEGTVKNPTLQGPTKHRSHPGEAPTRSDDQW